VVAKEVGRSPRDKKIAEIASLSVKEFNKIAIEAFGESKTTKGTPNITTGSRIVKAKKIVAVLFPNLK